MIESVQESPITLTSNTSALTFNNDDLRSRSANCECNGWLQHSEGSPLYQILNGGYYEVIFNANVSSATAGVVALGLYEDGILVPGTTIISTIATADDYENVKFTKVIKVCCRANATITIASVPSVPTPTTPATPIETEIPIVTNANLIIKRLS